MNTCKKVGLLVLSMVFLVQNAYGFNPAALVARWANKLTSRFFIKKPEIKLLTAGTLSPEQRLLITQQQEMDFLKIAPILAEKPSCSAPKMNVKYKSERPFEKPVKKISFRKRLATAPLKLSWSIAKKAVPFALTMAPAAITINPENSGLDIRNDSNVQKSLANAALVSAGFFAAARAGRGLSVIKAGFNGKSSLEHRPSRLFNAGAFMGALSTNAALRNTQKDEVVGQRVIETSQVIQEKTVEIGKNFGTWFKNFWNNPTPPITN